MSNLREIYKKAPKQPVNIRGQGDWQVGKSVLERNKYMLDQQINCDVTFYFNKGKTWKFPSKTSI